MTGDLSKTTLNIQWYAPQRVIYVVGHGPLQTADSALAEEMLCRYLDSAAEKVHLLVDVTRIPRSGAMLFHMHGRVLRHSCMGWIVTVGALRNPIINFGISALSFKTKIRHRDCPTLEAALAFLQQADETLPDLTAHRHLLP